MDDLCDPNFYLTYTSQGTKPITRSANEFGKVNGDVSRKDENSTTARATEGVTAKMNLRNTGISRMDNSYR